MTTIGRPRSGCEFTNVPGGMMVSCSRSSSSRSTCSMCKIRPAEFTCDQEFRGIKAGQSCDARLCRQCAHPVVGANDRHLCPPHRRVVEKADAWLDELTTSTRDVDALARNDGELGSREVPPQPATRSPGGDQKELDVASTSRSPGDVAVDALIARHGPVSPHDEQIVRDYARRLAEIMPATPPAPRDVDHRDVELADYIRAHDSGMFRDPAINERATISDKVAHVRSARQTRAHGCHWPGCNKQVPPAKWGCLAHWRMLPKDLQNAIWRAYQPGQEETVTPSPEYLAVADRVQRWIRDFLEREATTAGEPRRTSWGEAVHRTRTQDRIRNAAANPQFAMPSGDAAVDALERQERERESAAERDDANPWDDNEVDPDIDT